jgi:hypothetical protein
MTEDDWRLAEEPSDLLNHLEQQRVSERKWRLFACATVRAIWEQVRLDVCRRAVEQAERYADGLISGDDVMQAQRLAEMAAWPTQEGSAPYTADYVASQAAGRLDVATCHFYARWVAEMVLQVVMASVRQDGTIKKIERYRAALLKASQMASQQCNLIRDIFNNPFRPVSLNPTWRTPTVLSLAQSVYDDRRFGDLPVLADALEEAGCGDAGVLGHLRQECEHARGCWAVDLILGKS